MTFRIARVQPIARRPGTDGRRRQSVLAAPAFDVRCVGGLSAKRQSKPASMSPRPDLGFWPHLGYVDSRVERAAEKRTDADALRALEADAAARWYVVGGEMVALRKTGADLDPLFERAQAQALGAVTHTAFLGLMDGAPRFAVAIEAVAMEVAQEPRRLRDHRPAHDRGARHGRRRAPAATRRRQVTAALACAAAVLLQLRNGNADPRRRMAARLPVLQDAALSAHRSRS